MPTILKYTGHGYYLEIGLSLCNPIELTVNCTCLGTYKEIPKMCCIFTRF